MIVIQEEYSPSATSAMPRTAIMLPSVTITGLMRSASMRSALTAPTAAPVADGGEHCDAGRIAGDEHDAGGDGGGEHDGADGEIDPADEHDERHAEAEQQHRRGLAEDVLGIAERAEDG